MYNKTIKRNGLLDRCEERIIFEKIVNIQNEIISDILSDSAVFEKFDEIVERAVDKDEYLDLVHFNASGFEDCTAQEILDNYKCFFLECHRAFSLGDIKHYLPLVKFSNFFFEKLIEDLSPETSEKFHIKHRLDIIDYHRSNIYEHNLALAISQAIRCNKTNGSYVYKHLVIDDVIQDATIGLKKAIVKHNPYMGTKLSTSAMLWINAEINRSIDDKDRLIAIPSNVLGAYRKSVKEINKLASTKNGMLELSEIIEATGDDSFLYVEAMISDLDSPVSSGRPKEGSSVSLHDMIADENAIISYDTIEVEELKNKISELIVSLSEDEKHVVNSLFGLGGVDKVLNNKELMESLGLKTYEYNRLKNRVYSIIRDGLESDPVFNGWQKILEKA